ncbi:MAG: hypothetical protein RSD23_09820, partial [Ruthenibacterium sp.]
MVDEADSGDRNAYLRKLRADLLSAAWHNGHSGKRRISMNTIANIILSNAKKYPQKAAIVDHDGTRETTWAELLETATKIACYAQREGLSGIVPILQG